MGREGNALEYPPRMWHENLQSCQPSYEGDIYYFADEKIKSERRSASRSRSQQNSRDRVHSLHPTPAGALTGSESKVAIYYSPLPAISSVVVKTSVTPTRTTTKDSNKCGQGCGESETLAHGWWECKIVHPLWKTMWQLLRNDASLPYDVVSLLPSMYVLKSIKNTGPRKNLYMNLHISIICNSQKNGKNPNVYQLVSGYIKCGISMQWNTIQQ